MTGSSALELQLKGYRLTTAEILYHLPDHRHVLQTFIWQYLDLAPKFPRLRQFLDFWSANIDGPIHSVQIANAELVKPAHWNIAGVLNLH